jgi:hypothetical protein
VGGARGWRDSSIRAILVNPLYAGDMVWNRRTDARFHMIAGGAGQCRAVERGHAHGARLVPNDPADWITVRDTHEGLVSRKTWERARAIRLARPVSAGQVGVPKAAVVGGPTGGWTGARSRFILSGLLYCGRCGHRYQGVTRQKGTPRRDGTKVKTCSYACGGYIAKGTSACTFGPVGQEVLENAVIQAVLEFYKRYEGVQGRELLVRAVREAVGVEAEDLGQARKRLETDRQRVQTSIANLLDNITAGTRNLAERRLAELRLEHTRLEARAGELERLAEEEGRVQETVHELARFIASLEFTLRHGVGVEKMTALRRCVVSARVERGDGRAVVSVRWVPGVSSYTAVTTAEIDVVIH